MTSLVSSLSSYSPPVYSPDKRQSDLLEFKCDHPWRPSACTAIKLKSKVPARHSGSWWIQPLCSPISSPSLTTLTVSKGKVRTHSLSPRSSLLPPLSRNCTMLFLLLTPFLSHSRWLGNSYYNSGFPEWRLPTCDLPKDTPKSLVFPVTTRGRQTIS